MKNSILSCISQFNTGLLLLVICILLLGTDNYTSSSVRPSFNKANIFAVAELVDVNTKDYGKWIASSDSGYIEWVYMIKRNGASSLNFGFSEFVLPATATLSICGSRGSACQEFSSKIGTDHHLQLWTPILKGNVAYLKLKVLASEKNALRFRLDSINKGIKKDELKSSSQSCLIDIACTEDYPQINDFAAEIQSVGLITIEGTRICSGVLLNNVREDFTPYFLTARHCGINEQNAASVVVHWNYHNSSCRLGQESNKLEGDGSLSQFNSGATFLSDLQRSDFTLLRLNDRVIEEANAFFAGWDARSDAPINVTTIHHANTEEKRITFGSGPTSITRHFGDEVDQSLDHIKVENWNISSTAGGSSGAPLFDDAHRVVGQLHGGLASCGNQESDWFGRFHTGWVGDGKPNRQLKFWLDPDQTGLEVIDGIHDGLNPLALQIDASQISTVNCFGDSTGAILINIFNGAAPYSYSIDGGETYQSEALFQNLAAGLYTLVVRDVNKNTSGNILYEIVQPQQIFFDSETNYNQVTLSVSGGTPPFLFSHNGSISLDPLFTDLPNGVNTFEVTDGNGCTETLIVNLNYSVLQAKINIAQNISCSDSQDGKISVTHSGTIGPYKFQLNNGPLSESNVFTELAPGLFTATVLDGIGNIVNTQTILLEAPLPISAELIQVEENVSVSVTGGTPPYLFMYDDGIFIDDNQFKISSEVSVISIMDANGCVFTLMNIFTSVDPGGLAGDIHLFPNPVQDQLIVNLGVEQMSAYSINNISGKQISSARFAYPVASQFIINTTGLSAGIYFVNTTFLSGKYKRLKFIKL